MMAKRFVYYGDEGVAGGPCTEIIEEHELEEKMPGADKALLQEIHEMKLNTAITFDAPTYTERLWRVE